MRASEQRPLFIAKSTKRGRNLMVNEVDVNQQSWQSSLTVKMTGTGRRFWWRLWGVKFF